MLCDFSFSALSHSLQFPRISRLHNNNTRTRSTLLHLHPSSTAAASFADAAAARMVYYGRCDGYLDTLLRQVLRSSMRTRLKQHITMYQVCALIVERVMQLNIRPSNSLLFTAVSLSPSAATVYSRRLARFDGHPDLNFVSESFSVSTPMYYSKIRTSSSGSLTAGGAQTHKQRDQHVSKMPHALPKSPLDHLTGRRKQGKQNTEIAFHCFRQNPARKPTRTDFTHLDLPIPRNRIRNSHTN